MYSRWLSDNYGYQTEFLDREAVQGVCRTDVYRGGVLDWDAGHLHPLRYVLGLARGAEAAGVRIYERTEATGVSLTKLFGSATQAWRRVEAVGARGLEVEGSRVRGFVENGRAGPALITAGVYLMQRALARRIPAGRASSFEQDLLTPEVRTIHPLAFVAEGLFIDIGVPEDYARAQVLFAHRATPR